MCYEFKKAHNYINHNEFKKALEIYESFLKDEKLPDEEKEYYAICFVYAKIFKIDSIDDIGGKFFKNNKNFDQNECSGSEDIFHFTSTMLRSMRLKYKERNFDEVIDFGIKIDKDFLNDKKEAANSCSEKECWYILLIKSFFKVEKYEEVSILYSLAEMDCANLESIKKRYFSRDLRDFVDNSKSIPRYKTEYTEIYNDFSYHGDIYDGRSVSYNDLFKLG